MPYEPTDKNKLSRAKAERLIAQTRDPAVLGDKMLTDHKNRHVREKAKRKLAGLER